VLYAVQDRAIRPSHRQDDPRRMAIQAQLHAVSTAKTAPSIQTLSRFHANRCSLDIELKASHLSLISPSRRNHTLILNRGQQT